MFEEYDLDSMKVSKESLKFSEPDAKAKRFCDLSIMRRARRSMNYIATGLFLAFFGYMVIRLMVPSYGNIIYLIAALPLLGALLYLASFLCVVGDPRVQTARGKIVRIRRNQPYQRTTASFADIYLEKEKQYTENIRLFGGKSEEGDEVIILRYKDKRHIFSALKPGLTYVAVAPYLIEQSFSAFTPFKSSAD
ncbi:MAG: hypothetical protein K6F49_04760 [Saccharofermentans sp.]|nr:hypothetical protein [Saccharofermentans sp.]